MLREEIRYFFTALMFYSRIPCPAWVDHSTYYLQKSRKYFPLVGWIIGGIGVLTYGLAQLVLPVSISVLLSVAMTIYWTGAFHEDGFADVCDAFGGGWTKEQILTIMKDSRVGAYGTVGIILLLSLKVVALTEIGRVSLPLFAAAYLNGHVLSRFVASTFIETHDYVQDLDKSKSKPITDNRLGLGELLYSSLFVWLGLLLFYPANLLLLLAVPISYASKMYLGNFFQNRIGGYTGDCLGATQQVSELVFYLAVLAITRM